MPERDQIRLLTRHFFRRFFENDLLSHHGDGHEQITLVLAVLVMCGLWVSFALMWKSLSAFVSPFGRVLESLDDKYVGLAGSMLVTALGTLIAWDSTGLDQRDWRILGPLPLRPRLVVWAKVRALLLFVVFFALALNAIPALLYPPLPGTALSLGLAGTVAFFVAHIATAFAACGFGFLAVFVTRGVLQLALGPTLFRRVAGGIQFLGIVVVVVSMLVIALTPAQAVSAIQRGGSSWQRPPLWFLGAYERIVAPVLRPAVATAPRGRRQLWTLAGNARDRATYLALAPRLDQLAGRGVVALTILLALAGLVLVLEDETSLAGGSRRAAWLPRSDVVAAAARGLRRPVTRAAFLFTIRTLVRSARHRVQVAGHLAVGVALVLVVTPGDVPVTPGVPLLGAQMVLVFFLLVGLRSAFAVPAELRCNWLFEFAWEGRVREFNEGVRLAMICSAGVLIGLLLPLYVLLGGWRLAFAHALLDLLAAGTLVHLLLSGFRKLPFTCSYSPKGTFKVFWPLYLAAFLGFTYGFAALEMVAFHSRFGFGLLTAGVVLCLAVVRTVTGIRERRQRDVQFDDPPDEAIQRLGLELG